MQTSMLPELARQDKWDFVGYNQVHDLLFSPSISASFYVRFGERPLVLAPPLFLLLLLALPCHAYALPVAWLSLPRAREPLLAPFLGSHRLLMSASSSAQVDNVRPSFYGALYYTDGTEWVQHYVGGQGGGCESFASPLSIPFAGCGSCGRRLCACSAPYSSCALQCPAS